MSDNLSILLLYHLLNHYSVFPPGLTYVAYTSADCIFAGGHFLCPTLMGHAIGTLCLRERHSTVINDAFLVDIFKIAFTFVSWLLKEVPRCIIMPEQKKEFAKALEEYIHDSSQGSSENDQERAYQERKKYFINRLQSEGWNLDEVD